MPFMYIANIVYAIGLQGDYLVLGDADGTYDFSTVPQFVAPLVNGADMVMGTRLNGSIEDGAMPWLHRHIGNPAITYLIGTLFSSGLSDVYCGLRSIKRSSYEGLNLNATGMEFATEFVIEAGIAGVAIHEIPIHYRRRIGGIPKLRTARDGWRTLRLIASKASSRRRVEQRNGSRIDSVSQEGTEQPGGE